MKLFFTKGAGKHDRLEITRPGKAPEEIICPKQGIIPHDMVHFAVESVLAARGFLSRVANGESASFTMAPESESDSVERLVEVFQGDAWSGSESPAQQLIDLYQVTCGARRCPALPVREGDIVSIRARIAELSLRWSVVPIGQTLELELSNGRQDR